MKRAIRTAWFAGGGCLVACAPHPQVVTAPTVPASTPASISSHVDEPFFTRDPPLDRDRLTATLRALPLVRDLPFDEPVVDYGFRWNVHYEEAAAIFAAHG